jgi:hypothetical protein
VSYWIISFLVSAMAGAVPVLALMRVRPFSGLFPHGAWRDPAGIAIALHLAASAIVYLGFVRLVQSRLSREATCLLTALLGVLPWAVMIWLHAPALPAARLAARRPEAWLFAVFFIVAAGAFGLVCHERNPRIAELEKEIKVLEERRRALPAPPGSQG